MRIFIDDKGILCVSTTKFWQVLPASTEFHRTVIKKMDEALLLETCTLMAALEKDAR